MNAMNKRKVFFRVFLIAIYSAFLLIYAAFYGSKYGWMDHGQFDSQSSAFIENGSGSRSVLRGIVVTLWLGVQIVIVRCLSRREAVLTMVLFALVIVAY